MYSVQTKIKEKSKGFNTQEVRFIVPTRSDRGSTEGYNHLVGRVKT